MASLGAVKGQISKHRVSFQKQMADHRWKVVMMLVMCDAEWWWYSLIPFIYIYHKCSNVQLLENWGPANSIHSCPLNHVASSFSRRFTWNCNGNMDSYSPTFYDNYIAASSKWPFDTPNGGHLISDQRRSRHVTSLHEVTTWRSRYNDTVDGRNPAPPGMYKTL